MLLTDDSLLHNGVYSVSVLIETGLDWAQNQINTLEKNGCFLARIKGDHHVFKNPNFRFNLVVTHPVKVFPVGLVKDVQRKTGLKLK